MNAFRSHTVRSHTAFRRGRIRPTRCGVGLVELLVCLMICSMLLAAVAMAVNTGFVAYGIDTSHADLMQRARLTINRVTQSIRADIGHSPVNSDLISQFATGATVTDTGIQMVDPQGNTIVYSYDADSQKLWVKYNGSSYLLLDGVSQFQVTMEPMKSPQAIKTGGGWDWLRRADILLSVHGVASNGGSASKLDQSITLSAAVTPRRNAW